MHKFLWLLAPLLVLLLTCAPADPLLKSATYQKTTEPLIVGGRPATQGEVPYQLSLQVNDTHTCGASLVQLDEGGIQIGITAAHCITPSETPYYNVVAGDVDFADNTGIEQKIKVDGVIVHENYGGPWTLRNDIAILFLNASFTLNENVKTVPLPTQGQVTSQGNLTVSGWGRLEYNGEKPDQLQVVKIPLVNDTYCEKAYEDHFTNYAVGMICAGSTTGEISSPCHGDSGGPGISDAGYLAGIVSWGYECGHPNYPAVFTKVSHYVDWIHSTVSSYNKPL